MTVGPTSQGQNDFEWKDASGTRHNLADLEETLRKHSQWLESREASGTETGPSSAYLDPNRADLKEADLVGANLQSANLMEANLSGANLAQANLSGAELSGASLKSADLHEANLAGADLTQADLAVADLSGAYLDGADLSRADLQFANLQSASLMEADLNGAYLMGADLNGAFLLGAHLGRAVFEPKSLPELRGIAAAKDLELVTYYTNPDALVQLRKQFQDGGFRDQERKITYALKRRETELSCTKCMSRKLPHDEAFNSGLVDENSPRAIVSSSDSLLANCGSFVLNKLFFDWTCQYGMSPGRPLIVGFLLWLVCSFLYFGFMHTSGRAGLYRIYAQSIGKERSARPRAERISIQKKASSVGARSRRDWLWRECLLLRTSMFFSLMSAFNIGFRDINFGRWLRLLTRHEFDIKAVGWARVVAGWQALISVYLIALWLLTYFGRPFG
jgi:uncharacterized protein YjbI with pentapeptide repeats